MEREQVKKILLFCRDVDGNIKLNSKMLQDYEDRYYTTGGGTIDGMPKSKYKVSSPTETVALNIPDFVSVEMRRLNDENERLGNLKAAIMQELNKLPLPQKNIIYSFYIKGLQWVQISAQVHYSDRQCRRTRNRGLDNLGRQFSQNELIEKFNYPS